MQASCARAAAGLVQTEQRLAVKSLTLDKHCPKLVPT